MEVVEIEKLFDNLLLYEIEIIFNNKVIKSGKLKMVMAKNHNIKFYIDSTNSIKTIELYYPFSFKVSDNSIIFDYELSTLIKNNKKLKFILDSFPLERASKFINTKIIFKKK